MDRLHCHCTGLLHLWIFCSGFTVARSRQKAAAGSFKPSFARRCAARGRGAQVGGGLLVAKCGCRQRSLFWPGRDPWYMGRAGAFRPPWQTRGAPLAKRSVETNRSRSEIIDDAGAQSAVSGYCDQCPNHCQKASGKNERCVRESIAM